MLPYTFTCTVESLRETLATTKRSYEGRLSQSEAALSLKDVEVGVRAGVQQDFDCKSVWARTRTHCQVHCHRYG